MDKAQIRKIAKVARLRLTEAEEDELFKQIGDILKEFKDIQEMSAEVVKEDDASAYMTDVSTVLRKDSEPKDGENVLDNIPRMESGFVKTPKGI